MKIEMTKQPEAQMAINGAVSRLSNQYTMPSPSYVDRYAYYLVASASSEPFSVPLSVAVLNSSILVKFCSLLFINNSILSCSLPRKLM